ncbi:phage major tail tube protein [Maridesulfovibrio hydrothermalis]|uniref:Phage major tail tube protein n=1 Tax=Maridesulfovibrio hydrothermalis AM13 = DSM 14728 TaxID=1121451 RepID=L0R6A6_9BACT|nr:phage major tail tube protein [Maridesulfovibrio hydrothermalis]CCO22228.1 Phage major tail tube protein [Maridesulfovibrio hydrothermalis AM13 = DSM 14728]
MATTTLPKKLKKFTAFVDGIGYLGKVQELELPKLSVKTEEYRSGGMDAPVEIDMGMEKLEATATFAEYSPDLFKKFGVVEGEDVPFTFRGAVRADAEAEAVIIEMRGRIRELDMGTWKAGDDSTLKVSIALRYYRVTIAGTDVIEIDPVNMIRKIGGTDQLASERDALGI